MHIMKKVWKEQASSAGWRWQMQGPADDVEPPWLVFSTRQTAMNRKWRKEKKITKSESHAGMSAPTLLNGEGEKIVSASLSCVPDFHDLLLFLATVLGLFWIRSLISSLFTILALWQLRDWVGSVICKGLLPSCGNTIFYM